LLRRRKIKRKREKYLDTLIKQEVDKLNLELEEKKKFILDKRDAQLREILIGVKVAKDVKVAGEVIIPEGEYISENNVSQAIKIIAINPSNFIKDKNCLKK
jgi:hypothetical protein